MSSAMDLALLNTDVAKETWEQCKKDYAEILNYNECVTSAQKANPDIDIQGIRNSICVVEYSAVINKK